MTAAGASPGADPMWFAFKGDQLLLPDDDAVRVPRASTLEGAGIEPVFRRPVGNLDGIPCWAVEVPEGADAPEGLVFRDLRAIFAAVDEGFWAVAGRAKQLVGWHATHRFCGRCGGETEVVDDELAMRCARCGMLHHPRVSPAVIVRVRRGGEILLARSPGFPKGMMSILAGFVEPGESIEETIHREVREEVGIEVENLRYFGSQPWPFPNSLMIGFTADYAGGELRPEPGEIEAAGWYRADDLPPMPPRVSIARRMIDAFVEEVGTARLPENRE